MYKNKYVKKEDMEEGQMYCPICQSILVQDGQAHLETVVEHVFNEHPILKDKFICSNEYCISKRFTFCWYEWGGFYAGNGFSVYNYIKFVDNNTGAFNSFERKQSVKFPANPKDVYIPLLFGWKLSIIPRHEGNKMGEIVKRKYEFVLIDSENCYYHSKIYGWFHKKWLKIFHRKIYDRFYKD